MEVAGEASRGQAQAVQWYAVYTARRHEKRVCERMKDRQFDAFLPLYRSARTWKNRCHPVLQLPLFPNYVFVRAESRSISEVNSVPGVVAVVGSRREPWPLLDVEIELLRRVPECSDPRPHPYLDAGTRVRITAGPFTGMSGVLIRHKNAIRVVITIKQILQSFSVEVATSDLEAAN